MTWRTGVYWLRASDPTPGEASMHAPGSVLWSQCHRCGGRAGVALPADLGEVSAMLGAICYKHCDCEPSLRGARWELIVTLRGRLPLRERRGDSLEKLLFTHGTVTP